MILGLPSISALTECTKPDSLKVGLPGTPHNPPT